MLIIYRQILLNPCHSGFSRFHSVVQKGQKCLVGAIGIHSEATLIPSRQNKPFQKDVNNSYSTPLKAYLQLSKCRLTMLITATAVGGFFLPAASASAPFTTLGACIVGTTLLSASACALNNILEVPFDAQMKRTKSRVLVSKVLSDFHAFSFAGVSAFAGLGFLCLGCNPLTSTLGAINLGLYAFIYTPLKRRHHICTWVGAIVGAIPPIMGYTAVTNFIDPSALILAGILFSWQFPHFNALSWNLRADYEKANYKVMCVTDEALCRKTTLRHAIVLLILSGIVPIFDLSSPTFFAASIPLNSLMIYFSYKFYSGPSSDNAKKLFKYTLLYLPALMAMMIFFRSDESKSAINQSNIYELFDSRTIYDLYKSILQHRLFAEKSA